MWIYRTDICKLASSYYHFTKNVDRFKETWSQREIELDIRVSKRLVKMTMALHWFIINGPWTAPISLLLHYDDIDNLVHICLIPFNFILDLIFEFTISESLATAMVFLIVNIGAWVEIRIILLQYLRVLSVAGLMAGWVMYIIKHKFRQVL